MKRAAAVGAIVLALVAAFWGGRVLAQPAGPAVDIAITTIPFGFGQITVSRISNTINGRRACFAVYEAPGTGAAVVDIRDYYICD